MEQKIKETLKDTVAHFAEMSEDEQNNYLAGAVYLASRMLDKLDRPYFFLYQRGEGYEVASNMDPELLKDVTTKLCDDYKEHPEHYNEND